jgi:hypothetical protein
VLRAPDPESSAGKKEKFDDFGFAIESPFTR